MIQNPRFPLRRRKRWRISRIILICGLILLCFVGLVQLLVRRRWRLHAYISHIHPQWHPRRRSARFPSVTERVKLYMHIWYLPDCKKSFYYTAKTEHNGNFTEARVRSPLTEQEVLFSGVARINTPLLVQKDLMHDCRRTDGQVQHDRTKNGGKGWPTENLVENRGNTICFCIDSVPLLEMISDDEVPLFTEFGDRLVDTHGIPMIAKWRPVITQKERKRVTSGTTTDNNKCHGKRPSLHHDTIQTQFRRHWPTTTMPPILWEMESPRHWWPLRDSRNSDVAWEQKLPKAVWRGVFTGIGNSGTGGDGGNGNATTDKEKCLANQRCQFVHRHAQSTLVDAGLTDTLGIVADSIDDGVVGLKKSDLTMADIQKHKIIINLEGNDVSSGLKWQMLSQSVIMMPPPTATSWAMEELLEPWVHYIPLEHPDGRDAEEKVRWVLQNDLEAQRIAERSTLFMYDFLYHPRAEKDNRRIKGEIVKRYSRFWKK